VLKPDPDTISNSHGYTDSHRYAERNRHSDRNAVRV
jgi:hypothetical protein